MTNIAELMREAAQHLASTSGIGNYPLATKLNEAAAELERAQVMGRVHHTDKGVVAALNSIGRALPDDTKLYADSPPAAELERAEPVTYGVMGNDGVTLGALIFEHEDQAAACFPGYTPVPLYRHPPTSAVPEGWKLVPVEPTPEMLAEIHLVEHFSERALVARYKAMLSASPHPGGSDSE